MIRQIHNFHPETKEYLGTVLARRDPREVHNILVPANATTVAPPELTEEQTALWNGEGWDVVEDHRGVELYSTETGAKVQVRDIGPIPATLTEKKPPKSKAVLFNGTDWETDVSTEQGKMRQRRKGIFYEIDHLVMRHQSEERLGGPTTITVEQLNKLDLYAQELRDLGDNFDPDNIAWPTPPAWTSWVA